MVTAVVEFRNGFRRHSEDLAQDFLVVLAQKGWGLRVVGGCVAQSKAVVLGPAISHDGMIESLEMPTTRELRVLEEVGPVLNRNGLDALGLESLGDGFP